MNTTTSNIGLMDSVQQLDTVARIAALRAIVHSALAQAIGAIRQDIRDRARTERQDAAETGFNDLDQRNQIDEALRSEDELAEAAGFDPQLTPMQRAYAMHGVYSQALSDLKTIGSKRDAPLSLKAMLEFMAKGSQSVHPDVVAAICKITKCKPEDVLRMKELQVLQDRKLLEDATPEIIATFNGFGDTETSGYSGSLDDLPKIAQHQFGVKLVKGLYKAKDQAMGQALRSNSISELGSIPLIDEGISAVRKWVSDFETRYDVELDEVLSTGRRILLLEDVIPANER